MKDKLKQFLNWKVILIVIPIVIITVGITVFVVNWFNDENREMLYQSIKGCGVWGWFVVLGIQILQVVVAVIPGEPIEVFVGFAYGPWGGLITCLLGLLIGTVLIFYGVKRFGKRFINMFASSEKLAKFSFLQNEVKLESTVFVLFLIPGTPKDVLTYFVPLTKISACRFFLISTIARIPSVISSTYAGDTMQEGNWIATIIIFAIAGALGLLGIYFNDKYIQKKS